MPWAADGGPAGRGPADRTAGCSSGQACRQGFVPRRARGRCVRVPLVSPDFSPVTAVLVFATYVVIDVLYAAYIIAVGDRRAVRAAALSSVIYGLLAYGVVTFSKNIMYLVPLAAGAFVGTYITVRWRHE